MRYPCRTVLVGLGAALALAGCTESASDPTPAPSLAPPTTVEPQDSTAASFEGDVELIVDLWRRQTTAWIAGFDAGVQFWVDNNYPDMDCSFEDYISSRYPNGPVQGLLIERRPDPGTIERVESWVIPGGRLEGVPARGRVYEMSVASQRLTPGEPIPPATTLQLHVTIIDGAAYFFLGCS